MSTKVIIWKGFQMFSKNGRIEASPALIFVHLRNKIFLISVSSKCRLHAVSCSWARMSQFCTKPSSSSISPGCWLSTEVSLGPWRPDTGDPLPPALLLLLHLLLLLLLQVPGRHSFSAQHGHPPSTLMFSSHYMTMVMVMMMMMMVMMMMLMMMMVVVVMMLMMMMNDWCWWWC